MVMVVVEGGNVLPHAKREGDCPRVGNVRENMSGEYVQGENVRIPTSRGIGDNQLPTSALFPSRRGIQSATKPE